ncbi:hypothetical protein E1294_10495 [Nonomuraea diastatica]|uniref:Novel STAND NTPase 1 domain-containing protein n=1 Tax=Nonomuraea diastatica TaxID=1848329 RepID=A0A4V2YFE3_9ACTN|nr:hypothetical protein [Nonomuraea diastatica]TDD22847.1 hypothetical protein E1294_10495 [Nonomuraea diastatica]
MMPLLSPNKIDVLPLGRVSYGSSFPRAALPPHNPYVLALLLSWSPLAPPTRLAGMTISAFLRNRPVKRDAYGDPTLTLMAIDQVEELFSHGRRHQLYRDWFFGQLAEALRQDSRLHLLLSIRADRLTDLRKYEPELTRAAPAADGAAPERFALEALNFDSALEAARRPIQGTGRAFSGGAGERLVRDLVTVRTRSGSRPQPEGADPAQLQVVCEALWNTLPAETTEISKSDVLGHVDRTLSWHYAGEIRQIAADRFSGDDPRLRTWLRLTFLDPAGGSRTVKQSAIRTAGIGRTVIALLVKRRILRADQDMGERLYQLAYDRMLQPVGQDDRTSHPYVEPGPAELLREAESAVREGDLLLAARLCEEVLAGSVESDLRLRAHVESLLGNIAHEQRDLDDAILHYSNAAKSFETAGAVTAVGPFLTAIGRLRLAQGSPEIAVRELHAAVVRVPGDLTIQTELAWALWHGGHPGAAVSVLDGVLDREGNNTDALLSRGQILAGMGRPLAALQDLERAGPLRWPFAKVAHALALAQTESIKDAQQEMVEALAEEDMEHGPLLLYAARVEQLAGEISSAVDLARRAISAKAPALPHHMAQDARRLVDAAL